MKSYKFVPENYVSELRQILTELASLEQITTRKLDSLLKRYPKDNQGLFARDELVQGYHYLVKQDQLQVNEDLLSKIKLKPTRSVSGVLPLTVLTKPYPCPGRCIFCPSDVRMPKSYLSDEPGAQRAEKNGFDPYLQTYNRLLAFHNTGHNVAKIELIILGGTWSYYPENYQVWFIKRCFQALNDFPLKDNRQSAGSENIFFNRQKTEASFDSTGRRKSYNELVTQIHRQQNVPLKETNSADWEGLFAEQNLNETAQARCVGLVIETRPDHISPEEVIRIRKLGATKTQIGFQSLNDKVLDLNKRGHDVAATQRAIALLRSAGFKIHAHWMPNLYGSSVVEDKLDYDKLFTPDFQPDELKIYPCSLISTAELMDYHKKGLWQPYTHGELLDVLSHCLKKTPRYVRLTRVIRDIPSPDIVVGNKLTNFRELAEKNTRSLGNRIVEIRSREIKQRQIIAADLQLKVTSYDAKDYYGDATEKFLEFIDNDDSICGFLRLLLPTKSNEHYIPELAGAAIVREVHVYGVAQHLGSASKSSSQHLGLGTKLIEHAKEIATAAGYKKLAVISSIGTRKYYEKLGFKLAEMYQLADL